MSFATCNICFKLRPICSIGYSVFVATWNVGGKSPPSNMNLDDWLHASPAADIYVLGYALLSQFVTLIFLISSIETLIALVHSDFKKLFL